VTAIPLTQGKVALVSDNQFERVGQFNWYAMKGLSGTWYAVRNGKRTPSGREPLIYLHRFLLGITDTKIEVDHVDGNGLNCQDENLRPCLHVQNVHNFSRPRNNTTGFKGVSLNKKLQKYQAYIKVRGVMKHLGLFSEPTDAAKAYDKAAVEHFGEFAKLNFQTENST
jgi:hypothetical protein